MKNKLTKQQQKQRAESFFKYLKSLPPFSTGQQIDKDVNNRKNEPLLVLSSKVYQMNLKSAKSKKRVTFLQQEQSQNKLGHQTKKRSINSSRLHRPSFESQISAKDDNPEQICKDLLNLQRSIYQTFKIKQQKSLLPTENSLQQKNTRSQSILPGQKLQLLLQSRIKQDKMSLRARQNHLSKCQSERTVYRPSKQQDEEARRKKEKGRTIQISRSSSGKLISERKNSMVEKQTNDSFSGISRMNKKVGNSNENSTNFSSSRSQVFWKQQNCLMVQIFKKKLEGKFNLTSSKNY